MSDEAVREINLSGKQIVFLFMSATVAAVVIFLCGVLVGRGVSVGRELASTVVETTDPTVLAAPAVAQPGPDGAPLSTREELTYPSRLEEQGLPVELLGAGSSGPPAAPAPVATEERSAPAPPPAEPVRAAAPSEEAAEMRPAPAEPVAEPLDEGFVVQVAAVSAQSEAEALAQQLAEKGYPAFVASVQSGSARIFRVRVGTYASRREAESVANRLEQEEQFEPWITR